jgi:hypothetical protein
MNAQNAKEFLPLVQAIADGKTIQVLGKDGNWYDSKLINTPPSRYRIKPEPRTFEMWLYHPMGRMYPFVEGESFTENDEWERITVQEVIK